MRRKDKEIMDRMEIEMIIGKAPVCRLGMTDGEYPYVVPLCFGYRDNALYFHSALKGKKLDMLRKNSRVCFEMDIGHEIKRHEQPCKWGMGYKSVIGFGEASFIEDNKAKQDALDVIMAHYSDSNGPFEYPDTALGHTVIIKVDIRQMAGKKSE